MNELPSWIELLYRRGFGAAAFSGPFLLELERGNLAARLAGDDSRPEGLRAVALDLLDSDEPKTVAQSLAFLMFVGKPEDVLKVEPCLTSRDELVRKAAKTCRFELRQMKRRALS